MKDQVSSEEQIVLTDVDKIHVSNMMEHSNYKSESWNLGAGDLHCL